MSIYSEYIEKFKEIKNYSFIQSKKEGDTGVGYTFENIFHQTKADNNKYHVKSYRSNSNRILTLFAKTPHWVTGGRVKLLNDYGYYDKNGRWSLYTSIYATRKNKLEWQIKIEDEKIYLLNKNEYVIYWDLKTIEINLKKKYSKSFFISSDVKKINDLEYFYYKDYYYASGLEINSYINLIKEGHACIDLAMHQNEKKQVIDKGFLFRIKSKKLKDIYQNYEKLEI